MPRSSPQSALRYPLTGILGTEANVRILRELFRHGGQLSAPSLVARSGLAKTSVWAGLTALETAGILSAVGTGRVRLYSIQPDHPLREPLHALFEAEERRFQRILAAIRHAAQVCGQPVIAVWLYGSVARGEDRPDSDMDLAIVGAAHTDLTVALAAMGERLRAQAETLGLIPSLTSLHPKDVLRLARSRDPWWTELTRDALVLSGPRPDELASQLRAGPRGRSAA